MLKQKRVMYAHPHTLTSRKSTLFDKLVFIVAIVYPLSAVPQAIEVLSGKTDGVSLVSWLMFLLCSTLLLAYGLKHKVAPMIMSNSIWVLVNVVVVTGLLLVNTA